MSPTGSVSVVWTRLCLLCVFFFFSIANWRSDGCKSLIKTFFAYSRSPRKKQNKERFGLTIKIATQGELNPRNQNLIKFLLRSPRPNISHLYGIKLPLRSNLQWWPIWHNSVQIYYIILPVTFTFLCHSHYLSPCWRGGGSGTKANTQSLKGQTARSWHSWRNTSSSFLKPPPLYTCMAPRLPFCSSTLTLTFHLKAASGRSKIISSSDQ